MGLINLPLKGRRYTWSRANGQHQVAMARLDRFLISTEWNATYPTSLQQSLPNTSSDHCPILYTAETKCNRTNFFRFENSWLRSTQLRQLVIDKWQQGEKATTPQQLNIKLCELTREIRNWAKNRTTEMKDQIEACREYIGWTDTVLEIRNLTILEVVVLKLLKNRYTQLNLLEEDTWRQRAKVKWELEGDRGTKFFHAMASANNRNNMIQAVEYQGVLHSDQKTKAKSFFEFFTALMGTTSTPIPTVHWSNLYEHPRDLTATIRDITEEEIKLVIRQWPNNKSPGPDGFTGEFYRAFVDILVPDLHAVYQTVMNQNISLHPLNSSYIALIPKNDHPTKPQDYRPISLIHAVQRIFSKLLANRLKDEIEHLVQPAQTGFVRGRQITEGFLYAQQVIQHSDQQHIPMAIFKADIHKAFDTVSWEFLIEAMRHLGFPDKWLAWIQQTVLLGSSQIIINGLIGKSITLRRGVRQGDPLSPLLFIMSMDFLTRWLSKLVQTGAWSLPYHDMKPCLLYADDALIFLKPEIRSMQMLKIVFTVFKEISGLAINFHKSELFLVKDTQQQGQDLAMSMGCKLGQLPMTYLGLPLSAKKLTRADFLPLIQRF